MDTIFVKQFESPQRTGNLILDMHPFVKLNIMAAVCVLNFTLRMITFSAVLVVFSFLLAAMAGKLAPFTRIYSKVILFFGLFWFLFRASFADGTNVLFQFAGIRITSESIMTGTLSSLLVLGFSGIFLLFFQATPMSKLMLAFEKIGLSHTASYIFLSTFQSIIDLSANAQVIMDSQRARGIETEGNLFVRVKAYMPVLGPLVLNAVASTEEKAIAMETRAFSAPVKPTQLCQLPKPGVWQLALAVLVNLALVGGVVLRIAGGF